LQYFFVLVLVFVNENHTDIDKLIYIICPMLLRHWAASLIMIAHWPESESSTRDGCSYTWKCVEADWPIVAEDEYFQSSCAVGAISQPHFRNCTQLVTLSRVPNNAKFQRPVLIYTVGLTIM